MLQHPQLFGSCFSLDRAAKIEDGLKMHPETLQGIIDRFGYALELRCETKSVTFGREKTRLGFRNIKNN